MIRSILVPISPSIFHEYQQAQAIQLAQRTGARLYGLGVIDLPAITRPQPVPAGAGGFVDLDHQQHIKNAREILEDLRDKFSDGCKEAGVNFDFAIKSGNPTLEIRAEAHAHDLIVLSRESNFKFATQENPCQTARKVLKHNPRPVVYAPGMGRQGGRILIATDGSDSAARSVQIFLALGLMEDREIEVLSVSADLAEAEQHCASIVAYLESHGLSVASRAILSEAKPFEVLLNTIRESPPEAVIMGAFGVSGIKEMFFGSATETLLKNCTIPLWIYH